MTDTNSELDRKLALLWLTLTGEWLGEGTIPEDEEYADLTIDDVSEHVNQRLLKARRDELYRTRVKVGELTHAEVLDNVDKIVDDRIAEIEKEIE